MVRLRSIFLNSVVLLCLSIGTGCANEDNTASNKPKPSKSESVAKSEHVTEKVEVNTPEKDKPDEPEAVIIPLDRIWAYGMPGTRPINQMKVGERPFYETTDGALLAEVLHSLKYDPQNRPVAGKGFAVSGEGLEALREAHAVLVKGKEKRKTFRKDEQINLVFYSCEFGLYVHLTGVEQRGNVVQVTYRFVPHLTKELTHHFAIIPLTFAKTGRIRVEVVEEKAQLLGGMDTSKLRPWIPKIVCSSFVIEVVEE